jgi:hypothetical protein
MCYCPSALAQLACALPLARSLVRVKYFTPRNGKKNHFSPICVQSTDCTPSLHTIKYNRNTEDLIEGSGTWQVRLILRSLQSSKCGAYVESVVICNQKVITRNRLVREFFWFFGHWTCQCHFARDSRGPRCPARRGPPPVVTTTQSAEKR